MRNYMVNVRALIRKCNTYIFTKNLKNKINYNLFIQSEFIEVLFFILFHLNYIQLFKLKI